MSKYDLVRNLLSVSPSLAAIVRTNVTGVPLPIHLRDTPLAARSRRAVAAAYASECGRYDAVLDILEAA